MLILPDFKYGYIDKWGREVIPLIFDNVGNFNEGLAKVELNDKWGFIDTDGIIKVNCIYEDVCDFIDGLAYVRLNNQWGFIDINGNEYWEA